MKRLAIRLGISLASGMGLALALLWLLGNPRSAELPVAYAAEWHVCLSGCPYASIQAAVDAAGDERAKHGGATRHERAARPPQMQRADVPVAGRLLAPGVRRDALDG